MTYPFPRLLTIPVRRWFQWFISILKDNAEWFECTSGCLPTRRLGPDSKQTHVAHEVNKVLLGLDCCGTLLYFVIFKAVGKFD